MTKRPKVSIIVPNYNHRKYLGERIESILSQTFDDYELILLDDCSTDGSQELIMSYKDNPKVSHIIFNEKNTGSPFLQWEKGIKLAEGKYIWIAESDDTADSEFLNMTVRELDAHPEASLCMTGSHFIDENGKSVDHIYEKSFDDWEEDGKGYVYDSIYYLKYRMMNGNSVYNASMVLFRKEGCMENLSTDFFKMRYCGDWLFWIEQIRKGKVIEYHKKLNNFRKHSANTTSKGAADGNAIIEIATIKSMLYRQFHNARLLILKDKSELYYAVRHLAGVKEERKNELLEILDKKYGIRYLHYKTARIINSLSKHAYAIAFVIYLAAVAALCFLKPASLPDISASWLGIPADKIAHFMMFVPFPFLAYRAIGSNGSRNRRIAAFCAATAAGAAIAYGTEMVQKSLGYRTYEAADLIADMSGLIAGALVTAIIIFMKKTR